jgi:hypothetical protein
MREVSPSPCKTLTARNAQQRNAGWMDNVMKDFQTMKIVNWKRCAQGRNKWKSIVEQVKIRIELQRLVRMNICIGLPIELPLLNFPAKVQHAYVRCPVFVLMTPVNLRVCRI